MGKLPNKVTSIAAGEAHTLALTDGGVFSWGRGTFGRLGTGREDDELFPVHVDFGDAASSSPSSSSMNGESQKLKFVGIAAGAYHSLALQDDGSVWSWGYNTYGQLGRGDENASIPTLVERFQELGSPDSFTEELDGNFDRAPLKVCSIKAGGMMSLAIDNLGSLWIWGNCTQPSKTDETGFCLASSLAPLPVWEFHGHTVVKVACGNEHVVAAVSAGEMYTGGDLGMREKLAVMERYATVLHISVFRKPIDERNLPKSLDTGVFDIMRELESMMESADTEELVRLEMFYRSMLSSAKDKLMRRRVQEMVKDCLVSLSKGRQPY